MTITARSSVILVPPGYYPKLSMVLSGSYRPLLMTPKAIRQRAYNAAYHKRKRDVMP